MNATHIETFIGALLPAFQEGDPLVRDKAAEARNVQRLEAFYRAIVRGDLSAALDLTTDDITLEILGPATVPFVGRWQGRAEVQQALIRNFSLLEDQKPEMVTVTAQGDSVIVIARERGRYRPTGKAYDISWTQQFQFQGDRLASIREWFDSASLLEALQPSANTALMYRWFEEVWNQGRAETIDALLAADGIAHGLGEAGAEIRGPAAFRQFWEMFRGAFPDIHVAVEEVVSEGDTAAVRFVVTMTHMGDHLGIPATGKRVRVTGMTFARLRNGQIVEGWNNLDMQGLMQQIGAA